MVARILPLQLLDCWIPLQDKRFSTTGQVGRGPTGPRGAAGHMRAGC